MCNLLSWRQYPMTRKSNLWQHYGIEINSYENKTQNSFRHDIHHMTIIICSPLIGCDNTLNISHF